MKVIFTFLLLLIHALNVQAQAISYEQKIYREKTKEIKFYLISKGKQKSTDLLVLVQGSDCRSAINNANMIHTFGAAFPENDILLVEKTGLNNRVGLGEKEVRDTDCPVDYMKNDSPLERAENYIKVLREYKNAYRRIILLGGSEGAVVVNLIASKVDFIYASIALNGGGRYFIDDVIYNIRNTTPIDAVDDSIESFKQFSEAVKNKQMDPSQYVSGHGQKWWYEMFTLDNQSILNSVKTPHLVIQTMSDVNVDVPSTLEMVKELNQSNISFKSYQGLDHFFKNNHQKSGAYIIINDIQKWYRSIIQ